MALRVLGLMAASFIVHCHGLASIWCPFLTSAFTFLIGAAQVTVCDPGLCRVGWATRSAALDIGTDKHSFGYGGTGKKSFCRKFEPYGSEYGCNDVIGCCLDCTSGTISFTKNGQFLGVAFDIPQHLQGQVSAAAPAVRL